MKLGSLFDGIGGWLLAAQHAGIKPLWRCEIDEYPRAVSEYHFPDADSYGDIRKIHGNEIAPVDIICAGSPCQNLSVAGNRKGLQGSESSLFYESIRILKEMRDVTNGKYPRFFVWENVVGAFSSNHGNDFRAVLSEIGQTDIPMPRNGGGRWAPAGLAGLPECDIAWRTLDAQYWGVPQRRRRIFLVADFAAEGRCAAEILLIEKSVRGNTSESSKTWQKAAGSSENCSGRPGLCLNDQGGSRMEVSKGVTGTLRAQQHSHQPAVLQDKEIRRVRRLTPTECEHLQGLPNGYTDIEFRGKPASDARRYKAIGNGMAQPCADFVLKQIVKFQSVR